MQHALLPLNNPQPFTGLREIVFDTETTGTDRKEDRIIEIAAVEVIDLIPTGKTFQCYINPQGRKSHPEALKIHGLTDAFLKRKRKFEHHIDKFLGFVGDARLVAHNAPFDIGMLNAELARIGREPIGNEVVDTLALSKAVRPGGLHNLDALCKRYGIDLSKRVKHEALLDCQLLAKVYLELRGGRQFGMAVSVDQKRAVPTEKPDYGKRCFVSRITPEERAAHKAFVASLGAGAIWRQYLDPPPEQPLWASRLEEVERLFPEKEGCYR